jgi:hypothetical protein
MIEYPKIGSKELSLSLKTPTLVVLHFGFSHKKLILFEHVSSSMSNFNLKFSFS